VALGQPHGEHDERGTLNEGIVHVKERGHSLLLGDVRIWGGQVVRAGGLVGPRHRVNATRVGIDAKTKGGFDGLLGCCFAGLLLCFGAQRGECRLLQKTAEVAVGNGPRSEEIVG